MMKIAEPGTLEFTPVARDPGHLMKSDCVASSSGYRVPLCALCLLLGFQAAHASSIPVWAVNIGGGAYEAMDGTVYEDEHSLTGGEIGAIEKVKGTQDPFLYQSYRAGDIEIARSIANGSYDLTFHFAEPLEIKRGDRVFDVYVEGRRVIEQLDVMLFRDGKISSALTLTVPDVVVADNELNIDFDASVNVPVISALLVRERVASTRRWDLVWSDEFNGEELDASKWTPDIWASRKVNDEDQAYTARPRS
jgi:hypothetical protein